MSKSVSSLYVFLKTFMSTIYAILTVFNIGSDTLLQE